MVGGVVGGVVNTHTRAHADRSRIKTNNEKIVKQMNFGIGLFIGGSQENAAIREERKTAATVMAAD